MTFDEGPTRYREQRSRSRERNEFRRDAGGHPPMGRYERERSYRGGTTDYSMETERRF
jgi:hypothetical protein